VDTEKAPLILFLIDDRVSHERVAILTRTLQSLKKQFNIEILQGNETTEDQLIQKIEKQRTQLVFLPLHRYQNWIRVEGYFGINRTSGPTVAGYFCEPILFHQFSDPTGQTRRIILDFSILSVPELTVLIRSLLIDTQRSGLKPLLNPNSLLYCESWYSSQGHGTRTDHILNLPEIAKTEWIKRSNSIRILLSALWSLVYEEGPGKVAIPQGSAARTAKAYFQIGADETCLALRLYYYVLPHCSPTEAVKRFWPDRASPISTSQLLLKYSDFLRIHTIHETSDLEVVIGLFNSAPSEKGFETAHSIWIEPLSAKLIVETPYEAPGPNQPQLRALPSVSATDTKPRLVADDKAPSDSAKERAILDATTKIKELRQKVQERDDAIRELKAGGVGTAQPLPPADTEGLLEAFQQRYFEAKYQIRQFELQIIELEGRKAAPQEIQTLRLKMEALQNREKAWIKKLLLTLESYKGSLKTKK
jgi:hypothetical protein